MKTTPQAGSLFHEKSHCGPIERRNGRSCRMPSTAHRGFNNRAENCHVPLRKRERTMQGFRSPGKPAALRLDILNLP